MKKIIFLFLLMNITMVSAALVEDYDPPEIVCNDVIVSVAGNNTKVNYLTTVTDTIDPDPEVFFDPGPDHFFPIGITEITATAVDFAGNQNTCTFTVTVKKEPLGPSPWPSEGYNAKHTGQSPYVGSATNTIKWIAQFDEAITSPVIGVDGTIYFGCNDQKIYALNPDKSIKWSFTINTGKLTIPLIGKDGTIYFGSYCYFDSDNHAALYALDQEGVLQWIFNIENDITTRPITGSDGTIYVGICDGDGGTQGSLISINPDGTLRWSYPLEVYLTSSPVIGDDGTIYLRCGNGQIRALDQNGVLKWKSSPSYTGGKLAVGADNTLYLGSCSFGGGGFYATNLDGSLKWSVNKSLEPTSIGLAIAIGSDGTIYFQATKEELSGWIGNTTYARYYRKVYAFNADGKEKWSYTLSEFTRAINSGGTITAPSFQPQIYSCFDCYYHSSPAIGADGVVYVGSDDGKVYALNPDGSLKWNYQGGDFRFLSPAIGADGAIYVATDDGGLYAFGQDNTVTEVDTDSNNNQEYVYSFNRQFPFWPLGMNWIWNNNFIEYNRYVSPYWEIDCWPSLINNQLPNNSWWNYDYLISPWNIYGIDCWPCLINNQWPNDGLWNSDYLISPWTMQDYWY